MATPHNSAAMGDFARTVLMPGDPLRAKFIAETYLQDARLVNNVRGIHGYTGTYEGVGVSVMASGMGIPSMAIYATELYSQYGVENILRIGSAGAISPKLKLRDVVAAQGACTNSAFPTQYGLPGTFAPIADFTLLETAVAAARRMGIEMPVGNLVSTDNFYAAEIQMRRLRGYPPFADLTVVTASGLNEGAVLRCCVRLRQALEQVLGPLGGWQILGPAPAAVARVNNRYRYRLTLSGKMEREARRAIAGLLRAAQQDKENRGVSVYADLDPYQS